MSTIPHKAHSPGFLALVEDAKSRVAEIDIAQYQTLPEDGLILVDAPGAQPITGKVATVSTEDKKTIRLGDYKQPSFDCK